MSINPIRNGTGTATSQPKIRERSAPAAPSAIRTARRPRRSDRCPMVLRTGFEGYASAAVMNDIWRTPESDPQDQGPRGRQDARPEEGEYISAQRDQEARNGEGKRIAQRGTRNKPADSAPAMGHREPLCH